MPVCSVSDMVFSGRPAGEAVADAADGLDGVADGRVVFELGAQVADVDVDGAGVAVVLVAPDALEQLVAREGAAGVRDEELQELVLLGRQGDGLVVEPCLIRGEVEPQAADGQALFSRLVLAAALLDAGGTAQHGLDAREQLAHGEGLDDVVIGTELEAEHAVNLLGLGGQHDDGDAARLRVGFELAADFESVDFGQHDVEQHEVGLRGLLEGGPTVGGHLDFIAALLEVEAQEFADGRFIVYDEDLHGIILSGFLGYMRVSKKNGRPPSRISHSGGAAACDQ